MYKCEFENYSHYCGTVFPSAPALKSNTRYKHLRKTCKIRKKTFHSLSKLKSPKKGRTNLQEIINLVRCSRKRMISKEVLIPEPDMKPIDDIEEVGE